MSDSSTRVIFAKNQEVIPEHLVQGDGLVTVTLPDWFNANIEHLDINSKALFNFLFEITNMNKRKDVARFKNNVVFTLMNCSEIWETYNTGTRTDRMPIASEEMRNPPGVLQNWRNEGIDACVEIFEKNSPVRGQYLHDVIVAAFKAEKNKVTLKPVETQFRLLRAPYGNLSVGNWVRVSPDNVGHIHHRIWNEFAPYQIRELYEG